MESFQKLNLFLKCECFRSNTVNLCNKYHNHMGWTILQLTILDSNVSSNKNIKGNTHCPTNTKLIQIGQTNDLTLFI